MKNFNVTVPVEVREYSELEPQDALLIDEARRATDGAYAPYSDFFVGAALRMDDGTVVRGANQENAAFSSGTCAERSAMFGAAANHPDRIFTDIAIAARKGDTFQRLPISPCGACRQALLEYENKQKKPIRVLLYGEEGVYILPSVASLLPLCFTEF
ncbi:MAG: cytidine deaminase [Bacteroidales bacterium]|nr:cytidine deaminase [Bacteroidales bacterium]